MSGRKKHRKQHRGQAPHQLLDELSSLRDLLGSDMEVDIPLLDQVAGSEPAAQTEPRPPQKPVISQRPLEEADLPILFSPIDEEPVDDFTPLLSEADRELLRPLQNLPRKPLSSDNYSDTGSKPQPAVQSPSVNETAQEALQEPELETKPQDQPADAARGPREEFQPGLFDTPTKAAKPEQKPVARKPAAAAIQTSENPFLPPHIRARLTGGRVPKSEIEPLKVTAPASPEDISEPVPEPVPEPLETVASTPPAAEEKPELSPRELLIEQLVADQLPELERQLRANIIAMVNEIYPEED